MSDPTYEELIDNEILAERYAKLMVLRVALAANLIGKDGVDAIMKAGLVCDPTLTFDDNDLVAVSKEDLYGKLKAKMEREAKAKRKNRLDDTSPAQGEPGENEEKALP